ncbi:MAG: ABC transporter ATP-binding protein [Hyphomicrobiaceae bacterium]
MSNIAIELRGLSKAYRTYHSNTSRIASWYGFSSEPKSEFWAVKDISLALAQGECIAFLGANGAGKSTLLKLITGTIYPTSGDIITHGSISAILELGIGFSPELTGRQNIYQAGGMAGHSHATLTRLMPEIEAFAEIQQYFDEPLRTYSSGMHARLAFALATAIRPDILIVDEVLSVGDSYFQHKSFDRIRRFRREGTSILLVTHSMPSILAICDRAVLLDQGRVMKDGPPDEIVDFYNAMMADRGNELATIEQVRTNGWMRTRSGTKQAVARSVQLLDANTRQPVATAAVGQDLLLDIEVDVNEDLPQLVLGLQFRDRTGHVVWGTNTWYTKQVVENSSQGETLNFRIRFKCMLGPGSYSITHALHNTETHLTGNFDWADNNVVFDVVNTTYPVFIGTSYVDANFEIHRSAAPHAGNQETAKIDTPGLAGSRLD